MFELICLSTRHIGFRLISYFIFLDENNGYLHYMKTKYLLQLYLFWVDVIFEHFLLGTTKKKSAKRIIKKEEAPTCWNPQKRKISEGIPWGESSPLHFTYRLLITTNKIKRWLKLSPHASTPLYLSFTSWRGHLVKMREHN